MLVIPKEDEEARWLTAYLRLKGYKFHHSPNETGSSSEAKRRAIRMKQQGTSKGFPDYLVIVPGRLLAIELKRTKGSKVTPEQLEWLDALEKVGVQGAVCKGAEAAINFIEGALDG